MAVIEPKGEKSNPWPLVAGLVMLVLLLAVVGGGIYWMLKPVKAKQVKLTEEQAKQLDASGNVPNPPPGPAFPTPPAIEQAQDPGATMVTLDLKNVTVPEAVAALAKQANVQMTSGNGGQGQGFLAALMAQRINLSVTNQPFWTAVRELCKAGQLHPENSWDTSNRTRITLASGPVHAIDSQITSAGSSLLVLNNVTSTFDADLVATRAPSRSLNVGMTLLVEPKVSPYRITPIGTVETAVDENGTSLIRPKDPWDDRNGGGGGRARWMSEVQCLLKYPPNAGQRIAKLKGYVSVIIAGPPKSEKIKNPLAAKNVDVKVDGQTVRLMYLRKMGQDNYEGEFLADGNSPVFKEWDSFSQVPKLLDANGKEFNRGGGGWGGGARNTMQFTLYFNAQGGTSEPAEMEITLPTQMREIRVPFDFKDLPLPH